MGTELAKAPDAAIIERVMAVGDLSRLTPDERVSYYMATCRSVGLNPLTRPFDYISLNGKLTLYATKNCSDQLRASRKVSVIKVDRTTEDDCAVVTVYVADFEGRQDADIGSVDCRGLSGEKLSNAKMKAVTKAKRRATLSLCGLSFLDESELDSVPSAKRVQVREDGVIADGPSPVPEPDLSAQLQASTDQAKRAAAVQAAMEECRTPDELGIVMSGVAKLGLSKGLLDGLRAAAKKKMAALKAAPSVDINRFNPETGEVS